MQTDTHFKLNRWFLLISAFTSIILPFLTFEMGSSQIILKSAKVLEPVTVLTEVQDQSAQTNYLGQILIGIYICGSLIAFSIFIYRLIKIIRIRMKCKFIYNSEIEMAISPESISPFSFHRTMYISEKQYHSINSNDIILHEKIHITQRHSFDVLFAELICIITWFNPVSWMFKKALKETHEFLADAGVTEQISDKAGYFLLLFNNSIGVQTGLTNNFNSTLTLKRLRMMNKPRSGRLSVLKTLPFIPIAAFLLLVFSCGNGKLENTSSQNTMQNSENLAEKLPEFPGGQQAMNQFIIDNVKYPDEARKNGIQGKVLVSFLVSSTGKLKNINVVESVNELLDKEAVRVISSMPNWIPGEVDGKPVDMEMKLPIQFKLGEK